MESVMIRVRVVGIVMTTVIVLALPSTTQPVHTTSMDDAPCGAPCTDNSLCDIVHQECRFPCGRILCLPGDVCDSDTVTCQNTRECGDSCHSKQVSGTIDYFWLTSAIAVLGILVFTVFGVKVCLALHKDKKSQPRFGISCGTRNKIEPRCIVIQETVERDAQTNPDGNADEYSALYQDDQGESVLPLTRVASNVTIDSCQVLDDSLNGHEMSATHLQDISSINDRQSASDMIESTREDNQHSVCSTNSGTGIIDSSSVDNDPSVTSTNTGSMASMGSRDSGLGKRPENETIRKQLMPLEANSNDESPPSYPGAQCDPRPPTYGPQWREDWHAANVRYFAKQKDLEFASSSSSNSSSYSVHGGDAEHRVMDERRE